MAKKKELKVARHQAAKSSVKEAYYKRNIHEIQNPSVEESCTECT